MMTEISRSARFKMLKAVSTLRIKLYFPGDVLKKKLNNLDIYI